MVHQPGGAARCSTFPSSLAVSLVVLGASATVVACGHSPARTPEPEPAATSTMQSSPDGASDVASDSEAVPVLFRSVYSLDGSTVVVVLLGDRRPRNAYAAEAVPMGHLRAAPLLGESTPVDLTLLGVDAPPCVVRNATRVLLQDPQDDTRAQEAAVAVPCPELTDQPLIIALLGAHPDAVVQSFRGAPGRLSADQGRARLEELGVTDFEDEEHVLARVSETQAGVDGPRQLNVFRDLRDWDYDLNGSPGDVEGRSIFLLFSDAGPPARYLDFGANTLLVVDGRRFLVGIAHDERIGPEVVLEMVGLSLKAVCRGCPGSLASILGMTLDCISSPAGPTVE